MERLNSRALYRRLQERAGDRATFIDGEDTAYGYGTLVDDVRAFCALFRQRGASRGERIVIASASEELAIAGFLAALLDGLVPIMSAPDTPAARLTAIAGVADAALGLADSPVEWLPRDRVAVLPPRIGRAHGGSLREALGLSQQYPGCEPACDAAPDDLAYVLFTSGTTSAPKGVMVTHRNLFAHLETLTRVFAYTADSALFNGMVLSHGDGLVQGPLLAAANGCRLIRPRAFAAQTLEKHLDAVRAKRATHFISVPTVYRFIDRYAHHDDYFDAPEFAALVSVAAKLDESLWRRIERRFGRPVYNMYGLTETVASALYAGPDESLGAIGTIGKPIDVDVRLVRRDGTPAPDGEPGEIWLRGENVSPGYFADSTASTERYDGAWLKTGDLAVRRSDGAYEIRGRAKSAIMCGGFLIDPEELNEALLAHPAVAEAATVAVPDDDFGDIAVSAVVLDGDVAEADLTRHCSRMLEPMKVPKRIVRLPSIPRGSAGKPLLGQVRTAVTAHMSEPRTADAHADVGSAVLEIASRAFRVPLPELSLDSSPRTVPRWDSFAHLDLILHVEKRLGVRIPTADALAIDSLRKLVAALGRSV